MKKIFLLMALISIVFGSCAEFDQMMHSVEGERALTEGEVIRGLKEALRIGAEIASRELAKEDGYYGNELYRILLPKEASVITDNLHRIPGGTRMLDDIILRINRSAENAAKEVVPVFTDAIRNMTIYDGFEILRGADDSATRYLRANTYDRLFELYRPKIQSSLDQRLVAGVSTNEAWDKLIREYNNVARSVAGRIAGLRPVDIELDGYLTDKALEKLFIRLAIEEENIRRDPRARVTSILQRVFGSREAGR